MVHGLFPHLTPFAEVMAPASLAVAALALTLALIGGARAQDSDVVTCGGFVEASTDLSDAMKGGDSGLRVDYSRVHMHLYTSEGLLKYSTECAPNGGSACTHPCRVAWVGCLDRVPMSPAGLLMPCQAITSSRCTTRAPST